ncbi:flap endonuclease-1 [Candidatus Bathyarchaeota archaeon]|nr:flap endonuclease-1 [Candidatus Bathyarchaeota archaeon]
MGVDLGGIVEKRRVSLEDLRGRSLAVDGYNALYQFLAIIRGSMGEPLTDRAGRITSHLSGLFYRTVNMVERGIKIVYVFDGEPPALKEAEIRRRMQIKEEAITRYEDAVRRGVAEEARRYAQMTSRLRDEMVDDAKRLLDSMGVPWIQAPSEGEAQAAHIVSRGHLWAAASQDYDSLLFGAPILVRNLTVSGRRKLPGKSVYVEVEPEVIHLEKVLEGLGLTREQLIDVAILLGTDYNPGGFRGVGPKTAVKLIKESGTLERALESLRQGFGVEELLRVRQIFLEPKVTDDYRIEWRRPDLESTVHFLCRERDFSEERVRNTLERLSRAVVDGRSTLESFFKD